MINVEPISTIQQQQVVDRVTELLLQCEQQFACSFKLLPVCFDLTGRTSGMYVLKNRQKYFRFNPFIFAKYFEDGLATTVPHEVAHYVSDILYGIKNIRPHGKEWQSIMQVLGVKPQVTGSYNLDGIPVKRQRRFDYECGCMTHQITTTRHNKILHGKTGYRCQKCDGVLKQKIIIKCG